MSEQRGIWITCHCGKRFWRRITISEQHDSEMYRKVLAMEPCRACSHDSFRSADMCPESTPEASCGGGYHHDGDCWPIVTKEALQEFYNEHFRKQP